jgi:UDP:flavonoid glycosyltransferase YjiC (YdhE family)
MVVIPLLADQPLNAACCAARGVARVVEPGEHTPDAIRAAMHVRDEMAALPGPGHAVALLERLAAERRPILAAS